MKPLVQYGLIVYDCTSYNQLKPIFLVQKNASRLIFFKKRCFHTEMLFKIAKVKSIYDLYIAELLLFSIKSVCGKHYIQEFNNMFVRRQVTAMPTRSVTSGCFQLLDCRSLVNKNSILHRGAVLLNFLIANGINLSSDKCQEGQYFEKVLKESTKLLSERSYHKTLFKQNV